MIRSATMEDADACLELAREFYPLTAYEETEPFDDETVYNLICNLIVSGILNVVENDDGGLVGMIGMAVVPFSFNKNRKVAVEVIWWLSPNAMGKGVGKALLESIDGPCEKMGVHRKIMMHLKTSHPNAAKLLLALGYDHTETIYTKVV
jgi:GNAT superfamily N-acetyltransferase